MHTSSERAPGALARHALFPFTAGNPRGGSPDRPPGRTAAALRRAAWAVLVVALWGTAGVSPAQVELRPGDPFPDLEFYGLLDPGDYSLLDLGKSEGPFRLSEIAAEVLVLEFFNKSCVPCQQQVRQVQAFFEEIREKGLWGRVRLVAIAAGNQPRYLGRYRKRRKLTYPITADPRFDQWRRIGDPGRTPFTVFLVQRGGRWLLARYSFGIQWKSELLRHSLALLDFSGSLASPDSGVPAPMDSPLVLPLEARAVREKAARLLRRAGNDENIQIRAITLRDGTRVFQGYRDGVPLPLFARVASRRPVCEVCEAVHFLFAFDDRGRVLGFEPIHVTKFGNEEWSEADARFFESRLKGRKMNDLPFDPEVDAVSKATMSSALIFDEIRRTVELLKLLPGS